MTVLVEVCLSSWFGILVSRRPASFTLPSGFLARLRYHTFSDQTLAGSRRWQRTTRAGRAAAARARRGAPSAARDAAALRRRAALRVPVRRSGTCVRSCAGIDTSGGIRAAEVGVRSHDFRLLQSLRQELVLDIRQQLRELDEPVPATPTAS